MREVDLDVFGACVCYWLPNDTGVREWSWVRFEPRYKDIFRTFKKDVYEYVKKIKIWGVKTIFLKEIVRDVSGKCVCYWLQKNAGVREERLVRFEPSYNE